MSFSPTNLPPVSELLARFKPAPLSSLSLLKQTPAPPPTPTPIQPTHQALGLSLLSPDRLLNSAVAATQKSAPTQAQTELSFVNKPLIGPDDRVLHIGDSHTVGIYGQEMDKHLRATGAKVETYGSAGSSPLWWKTGQTTRSGFFSKNAEGQTVQPANWKDPHPTPKFKDLVGRFQPNVIMISLGANLIHSSGAAIEKQVHEMAQMAQASGAKIIWVGPPDGRESKKPTEKQTQLYEHLQRAASQYGDFIDSRPLTEYPATGGDGVHYWGTEGSRIARNWAKEVFEQIQALPEK